MAADMGWDDDSSDSDSQQLEATPNSWATGAFEPFEVDEPQATEVNFLKAAYNKKVRAVDLHNITAKLCRLVADILTNSSSLAPPG